MQFRERLSDIPLEATVSSVATKVGMPGGVLYTVYGWLSSSAGAIVIGVLVTVLGFVVNFIYQKKRDAREDKEKELSRQLLLAEDARKQEIHVLQMRALQHQFMPVSEVIHEDTD